MLLSNRIFALGSCVLQSDALAMAVAGVYFVTFLRYQCE